MISLTKSQGENFNEKMLINFTKLVLNICTIWILLNQ